MRVSDFVLRMRMGLMGDLGLERLKGRDGTLPIVSELDL